MRIFFGWIILIVGLLYSIPAVGLWFLYVRDTRQADTVQTIEVIVSVLVVIGGLAMARPKKKEATAQNDENGSSRNEGQTFEKFQRDAQMGNSDAQYSLGCAYATGSGVPKDSARAYAWLNLAVVNGDLDAASVRDEIEKGMTENQKSLAKELSEEMLAKPELRRKRAGQE